MDEIIQGFCLIEWHIVYETAITLGLAALIGLLAYWYRNHRYKKQENSLYELAKLRTSGVRLRNRARGVNLTGSEFTKWKVDTDKWKDDIYETAGDISPVVGERLRTLDLWVHEGYTGEESEEQKKVIAYITETLKRTDDILEKWFRPTDAP